MSEIPTIRPENRMLIDGKLVEATDGATFEVVNPANQQIVGSVADASPADMAAAIAAARRAFDETEWSTNREMRKECLSQLKAALVEEQEELREQLIQEAGAPRLLTGGPQLDAPLAAGDYVLDLMDDFEWEIDLGDAVNMQGGTDTRKVVHMAAGVVGAITPWNFPFEVGFTKIMQAMATGNTVVYKPAHDTPFNATLVGRLAAERTDIPPGVLNVVTSSEKLRGEQLVTSPDVDLISFTGSTAVGQRIMEKGAETLKRLFLELGGKSATIMLDDGDMGTAAFGGAMATCTHSGQGCAIPTRLLLPRSRYDEGVEMVAEMMQAVPYGDPQRPDVLMGPLISQIQRDRVLGYIEKGKQEGARLVLGGGIPSGDEFDRGFFVEPTLFADVDNSMTIAQEEIFGPVLVLIPFEDDDDAVRIANDSRYGLGGGVISASLERSMAVADRIRTGMLSINGGMPYGPDLPFGGFKYSGVGRQNGPQGFHQYLEPKSYSWPAAS